MSKTISLVILQAIFCSTFLTLSYSADNNLLDSTCKQTPNYSFCIQVLSSRPQYLNANISGLALIAASVASQKAEEAVILAQDLLLTLTDQDPKMALGVCIHVYEGDIVELFFPAAVDGINKGDPKFAVECAALIQRDIQICVEWIEKTSMKPLWGNNKIVHDVVVIFQTIASLMLPKKLI